MPKLSGIAYLESLPAWDGANFCPIEVPRRMLEILGRPQDDLPAVHIAGTNGKGSVSTFVAASLLASGFHVGQFASPHLSHVTERCIINGRAVDSDLFGKAVEEALAAAESEMLKPSFFVLGAVACFLLFSELKLDWMVIEVGLGGRLDATNVIERPAASAITSIGFDHTQHLGGTLAEIAREKAGIMRAGVPAFVGVVSDEVQAVLDECAGATGAPVEFQDRDFSYRVSDSTVCCRDGEFALDLSREWFRAEHHRRNAVLAARISRALGVSQDKINEGLRRVFWPGRLERILLPLPDGRELPAVLDAAHNIDGIEMLGRHLEQLVAEEGIEQVIFVLSVLLRKDWRAMSALLSELAGRLQQRFGAEVMWIATHSGNVQALDPEELKRVLPVGALSVVEPEQAIEEAKSIARRRALLVISGSIFLIGRLRPLLVREPFCTYSQT